MNSVKSKREFEQADTQCVKGVAILLLLYYHLFRVQFENEAMGIKFFIPVEISEILIGFGNICVAIFLFLSAYGMTKKLLSKEQKLCEMYSYSLKRLLTIVIHFVVMFISVNALWFHFFDYARLYGEGKQGIIFMLVDAIGFAQIFRTPTLCETWWYMEIAIICIVIIPLLVLLVKKAGWKILLPALLLPCIITLPKDFGRYYLVMVLGVVAAKEDWLTKLHETKIPKAVKVIVCLLLVALSVAIRQNFMVFETFAYLIDAPIAFLLVYSVYEIIPGKSIPGRVLGFLGKHSMNIYFVHTFFYLILWRDYIYKPKVAILIYLCLLFISLLYSVLLELVKKLVRVPKLIAFLDRITQGAKKQ